MIKFFSFLFVAIFIPVSLTFADPFWEANLPVETPVLDTEKTTDPLNPVYKYEIEWTVKFLLKDDGKRIRRVLEMLSKHGPDAGKTYSFFIQDHSERIFTKWVVYAAEGEGHPTVKTVELKINKEHGIAALTFGNKTYNFDTQSGKQARSVSGRLVVVERNPYQDEDTSSTIGRETGNRQRPRNHRFNFEFTEDDEPSQRRVRLPRQNAEDDCSTGLNSD